MTTKMVRQGKSEHPTRRGNGEGSVYWEPDRKKWCVAVQLPSGKRKRFRFKDKKQADRKLREAVTAREQGTLATGPRTTLANYIHGWLEDVVRMHKAPRTYETYESKVRLHILPELGKTRLDALAAQQLRSLYAKKSREGMADGSIGLIHTILYSVLKMAEEDGLIPRNVARHVKPPRRSTTKGEERAFSEDQAKALVKAIEGHRFENFLLLLAGTALRFGEAAGLRWQDVNLERGSLVVNQAVTRVRGGFEFNAPKTASSRRHVPLGPRVVAVLRAQRVTVAEARLLAGADWQHHDLVFPNRVGKPLREDHVLAAYHKVLETAGLPRRRLHDLRHTVATYAFANGADSKDVQELLGHSRIDMTTRIYMGPAPERLRAVVNRLDGLFGDLSEAPPLPKPEEVAL